MIRNSSYLFVICLICVILSCKSNNSYEKAEIKTVSTHSTDGDLSIDGPSVEVEDLENYESEQRIIWQKPDMVIKLLGDISDKVIADLGAGSGYFAFRMVDKAKKVIALDVSEEAISWMDSIKTHHLPKSQHSKIEIRKADFGNSNLKVGEADVVIVVNTYMWIEDRVAYFAKLLDGLKEGGSILIIDWKKKNLDFNNVPPQDIRVSIGEVENELLKAGWTDVQADDRTLSYQYIVQAKKPLKN